MRFCFWLSFLVTLNITIAIAQPKVYVSLASRELGTVHLEDSSFHSIGYTPRQMLDIALCPNGKLYGISDTGIYAISRTDASSIRLTADAKGNSLVCDSNGLLWTIGEHFPSGSGNHLINFNPADGAFTVTGALGFKPWGDLTFIDGNIYSIGYGGGVPASSLVEIGNLSSPVILSIQQLPNNLFNNAYGTTLINDSDCIKHMVAISNNNVYHVSPDDGSYQSLFTINSPYVVMGATCMDEFNDSSCMKQPVTSIDTLDTFVFPNAFTPNNDGRNDVFFPLLQQGQRLVSLHIYNRFGALICNSTNGWDGNFQQVEQPSGTYIYYAIVEVPDSNEYRSINVRGSITLQR